MVKKVLRRKPRPSNRPATRFWLYAGDRPTEGGMRLIRALAGKRIIPGGRFKYNSKKIVINWGVRGDRLFPMLNDSTLLNVAVNKLAFFRSLGESGSETATLLPPWTENRATALRMVSEGHMVVARTVLNGHSGEGIEIRGKKNPNPLPESPLYVRYIPKDEEYRIHVIRSDDVSEAFYIQKKVKRPGYEGKHNRLVRNHEGGYTYQHNDVTVPPSVLQAAITVFNASGLVFGAVDVIFTKKDNRAYVLEINTAPGLEGESVNIYANAFKKYYGAS